MEVFTEKKLKRKCIFYVSLQWQKLLILFLVNWFCHCCISDFIYIHISFIQLTFIMKLYSVQLDKKKDQPLKHFVTRKPIVFDSYLSFNVSVTKYFCICQQEHKQYSLFSYLQTFSLLFTDILLYLNIKINFKTIS